MKKKNYQIIEPEILEKWMATATHNILMYGVLQWLATQLIENNVEKFQDIEIDVVPVEYVGMYLTLGIHYKKETSREETIEIENFVQAQIEQLLVNKTALDFISESFEHEASWQERAKKIEDDYSNGIFGMISDSNS